MAMSTSTEEIEAIEQAIEELKERNCKHHVDQLESVGRTLEFIIQQIDEWHLNPN